MFKLLLPAFIAMTVCLGSDTANDSRLIGPLAQAGIRLDDEVALIRVLQGASENPRLATCAAYALGKLPASANSITELNLIAAVSDDATLVNYAIRSLIHFGDRKWVDVALQRLPNTREQFNPLLSKLADLRRHAC